MPALLTHPLFCHPATPCAVLSAVEVATSLAADGALLLTYRLCGSPDALQIPAPRPAIATDGLWQHTCCELFVADVEGEAYREFNFSPSGEWAAYGFSGYRVRDASFLPDAPPQIRTRCLDAAFLLEVQLPPSLLPAGRVLHLGLSVVVESLCGGKSYWALSHAAAQPDFHLRSSFALTLIRNTP